MGALLVAGLAAVAPSAAQADDGQVEFFWTEPGAATVAYGQYWNLTYNSNYSMTSYQTQVPRIASSGTPSGWVAGGYTTAPGTAVTTGSAAPSETQRPLDAGTYTFDVVLDEPGFYHGTSTTSAKLVVTPATLGIELRVVADDSAESGAIITARFTGQFVDEYAPFAYPTAALSPAGTWQLQLVDGDGAVIDESSIEREAGDDILATSFYSSAAKAGETYSATATFVPTGQSVKNFTINPAADFDYTAPDNPRAEPSSSATAKPVADLPAAPDFSVPLWWVLLIGVLLTALIVFAIVFSVRLGKAPARDTTPPKKESVDAE